MEGHTRDWHIFISGECVFCLGNFMLLFLGGFAWINVIDVFCFVLIYTLCFLLVLVHLGSILFIWVLSLLACFC